MFTARRLFNQQALDFGFISRRNDTRIAEITFLFFSLFGQDVTVISVFALNLTCAGESKTLLCSGICFHFWHNCKMFWLNIARKDNFFFVIVQQIGNFSTEAVCRPRFFASLRMTNKVGAYDGQLIKCGLYRSPKSSKRTMISSKVFVFLSAVCPRRTRRTLSSPINVGKQQPRRYTRHQLCCLSAFPALLELLCLLDLLESLAYTNLAVIPETKSP